jgi:hypothetical protein
VLRRCLEAVEGHRDVGAHARPRRCAPRWRGRRRAPPTAEVLVGADLEMARIRVSPRTSGARTAACRPRAPASPPRSAARCSRPPLRSPPATPPSSSAPTSAAAIAATNRGTAWPDSARRYPATDACPACQLRMRTRSRERCHASTRVGNESVANVHRKMGPVPVTRSGRASGPTARPISRCLRSRLEELLTS